MDKKELTKKDIVNELVSVSKKIDGIKDCKISELSVKTKEIVEDLDNILTDVKNNLVEKE